MNLKGLNENQLRAVTTDHKRVLVNAGAGSGKTRVVSMRVAYLMHNRVGARNIYCITFTRYAAEEMKERIIKEDKRNGGKVFVGTFHAFALNILRKYGDFQDTSILGDVEKTKLVEQLVKKFKLKSTNILKNLIKNYDGRSTGIERIVLTEYMQILKSYNVIDVDLIIPITLQLLKNEVVLEQVRADVDYLIVDELQDSSELHQAIIDAIIDEDKHLFCVGDDAQSIYGWNNAKIDYILDFEKKYNAEVINLDINYRSSHQIVQASNNLISYNKRQLKKNIIATRDGDDICFEEFTTREQQDIKLIGDILGVDDDLSVGILCRTNADISHYANLFNSYDIEFCSSAKEKGNDRILNIIDSVINVENDMLIDNVMDVPKEIKLKAMENNISYFEAMCMFKGNKTTEKYKMLNKSIKKVDAIRAYDAISSELGIGSDKIRVNIERWLKSKARLNEGDSIEEYMYYHKTKESQELLRESNCKVSLLTVHASKGLEFDHIYLPNVCENNFPKRNEDLEEATRLFYVAITRAKSYLKLYHHLSDEQAKSRFINQMMKKA
ncbi:MAG: ATP-dependent helicase [Clostridium sp.]